MIVDLKIGEKEIPHQFVFNHKYPSQVTDLTEKPVTRNIPGGTGCTVYQITDEGDKKKVAQVQLTCHHNDRFCKETGRKHALTAVLNEDRIVIQHENGKKEYRGEGMFTKEQRRKVWLAYFDKQMDDSMKGVSLEFRNIFEKATNSVINRKAREKYDHLCMKLLRDLNTQNPSDHIERLKGVIIGSTYKLGKELKDKQWQTT